MEKEINKKSNINPDVEKLIFANKKLREDNNSYCKIINSNNSLIKENEKQLWKICDHQWQRDYEVAFDDRIKYFCSKCGLWNNEYMYK